MTDQTKKLLSAALALALLAGCSDHGETPGPAPSQPIVTAAPTAQPTPSPTPFPAETPAGEKVTVVISAPEDIQEALHDAIGKVEQPAPMDISGIALGEDMDMAVKNLYYDLTRQFPELKYAYDVSATAEDGVLTCRVSYMPYKTGDWLPTEDAVTVSDLGELLRAAEEHMGAEALSIRVTDPDLTPDEMDRVLRQAGGGYILCMLNRDGTGVTYTPAMGMDMEECLSLLDQADELAEEIVSKEVDGSMTEREKAEALYAYLTENVAYDRRYYSDRENMPYGTQTAIGALRDGTAICGGYSHALKLLFEKAGFPCFNVTGKCFKENHMWNLAKVDGKWLWFDATSDRGISPRSSFRFFAREELDETRYQWEQGDVDLLLRLAEEYVEAE